MKKISILLILILAAILRLYNATAVSLWHDEAFSALYIFKYNWAEMMHRIILDVHPPLYYIVLRVWNYVFGHGLMSLRGFSIILGLATVWMGYVLIKKAFKNESWALLAALLLAINPYQIDYAHEARMYTLGTFLTLLSCYLLLKAFESSKARDWIFYGIAVAAVAYTHYFLLFTLVAQGLYFAYYCLKTYGTGFIRARNFLWGAGAYVLSVILYLPWVPSFIEQNQRVDSGYWIPKPDRWSLPGTIWKMAFSGNQGVDHATLAIATLVALALLIYFMKKIRQPGKWLIVFSLIVPFACAIVLSYKQSIYQDRYFVFASLFFSIVIALALANIPKRALSRILLGAFVIASVVMFFKNWQYLGVKDLFTNREVNRKPGMAAAAQFINDNYTDRDHIFVGSSFIFFTYQYYNQTQIKPLLLSDTELKNIPHFAGTAILSDDELQLTTGGLVPAGAVNKDDNVWLVWTTGFGGSKPNVPGNWGAPYREQTFFDSPDYKGYIQVLEYHVK